MNEFSENSLKLSHREDLTCDFLGRPMLRSSVLCSPLCCLGSNYVYIVIAHHTNWCQNSKETCLFQYIQSAVVIQKARIKMAQMSMELEVQLSPLHGYASILCIESGVMGNAPFFQLSSLQTREQLPRFHQTADFVIHFLQICLDEIKFFILKFIVCGIILIILQDYMHHTGMLLMDFMAVFHFYKLFFKQLYGGIFHSIVFSFHVYSLLTYNNFVELCNHHHKFRTPSSLHSQ